MSVNEDTKGAPSEELAPTESAAEERKAPSITALISQLAESADSVLDASGEMIVQSKVHSLVGQTLDNKYAILKKVGQGGMGVVYKARHTLLDRFIALKVLNPSLAVDEQALKRFLREAKTLSKLKHPNAISLYEFGIDNDLPYLVMEFVDGRSLNELIHRDGALSLERTNNILQQVCGAVASAHELGIIHRDLKPDNIMITERPNGDELVQVLDFGVAKLLSTNNERTTKLTTGVPCGTPHYMSPELITGEPIDGRSDVYALGIILFEMLAGETPFEQDSIVQILFKQVHTEIPLLSEFKPGIDIPSSIEDVICKAVEKDPDDRYQSVTEFAAALQEHVHEQPVSGKPSLARKRRIRRSSLFRKYETFADTKVLNISNRQWIRFHLVFWSVFLIYYGVYRFRVDMRVLIAAPVVEAEQSLGIELPTLRRLFSVTEVYDAEHLFKYAANWLESRSLKVLIDAGIYPDTRDATRKTPLHKAVAAGAMPNFLLLLRAGADPSAQDEHGVTPLHAAAHVNQVGMLYTLLREGVAIDARDRNGRTPLMYAVLNGSTGAVYALVDSGASVQSSDNSQMTPLLYAVKQNELQFAELLLDRGAPPNVRDGTLSTALMLAARGGSQELLSLLLSRGAEVNAKNASGDTALHFAVAQQRVPVMRVLMEAGADPYAQNQAGKSPLDAAKELNQGTVLGVFERFVGRAPDPRERK